MDTKCVCGSRLYEHTVLVPQCVPSKSYVYLCYLTISRPFISQAATPTVPVAPTATAIVTPPATVVSGIISTSSRQHAITSGSTRAPAITEFRIPQTVKGNVAKKRKASAQHCLPQHRGARSTAPFQNVFDLTSTKEAKLRVLVFPHIVRQFHPTIFVL